MKKALVTLILLAAVLFVLVRFVFDPRDESIGSDVSKEADIIVQPTEVVDGPEGSCALAGGTWNACGSACRANPEDVCIDVCVEYCECQSDEQCPAGLVCADFVEDQGVCL